MRYKNRSTTIVVLHFLIRMHIPLKQVFTIIYTFGEKYPEGFPTDR
jgi:hypothetical protein